MEISEQIPEQMAPPKELWLIFDFTNLSLFEMKKVYQLIKNDTDGEYDIQNLERCYTEKKRKKTEEEKRNGIISRMKKPFKKEKISPPKKEQTPVVSSPSAPGVRMKLPIIAPRQWWA
jgi:hypothetical protein